MMKFLDCRFDILQRHAAQAEETRSILVDQFGQLIVDVADQHLAVRDRKPVRHQFGHARDRLVRDLHDRHFG